MVRSLHLAEMQTVSFLLLLVIGFSVGEQDATYQELFKKSFADCIKENDVDPGIVNKVWTQPDFPADKESLKCFYNCMNKKLGITDENGTLNDGALVKAFAHYNSTDVSEIKEECKDVKVSDGDLCEFAYQLVKCIAEFQLN